MNFNNFCVKWTKHSNITFADKPIGHINVGVFPSEVIKFSSDSSDTIGYVCTPTKFMLEIMSSTLRCSINFSVPKDDFSGYKVNGSWNGILSLFEKQLADIILKFFAFHTERDKIADLGPYIPSQKLISILSAPSYKSENVLKIFFTFSSNTWILLIIAFISVSSINGYIYHNCFKRFAITIDYFGALLAQSSMMNHKHLKILAYVWLITTLLIRNFFTLDIHAQLLSKKEILIDSFDQLIDDNSIIPLIEENSSLYRIVVKEFPKLSQKLVKISHRDPFRATTLTRIIKNSHALITSENIAEYIMFFHHKFRWHKSEQSKYSAIGGIPVRKGFNKTTKEKIFKVFRALFQFGIYGRNRRKEINYFYFLDSITSHKDERTNVDQSLADSESSVEDSNQMVIKLRSLLISFVLLAFGCIFSFIALFIELVLSIELFKFRKVCFIHSNTKSVSKIRVRLSSRKSVKLEPPAKK